MIYFELSANSTAALAARSTGHWLGPLPPRRHAFDTFGEAVVRVCDRETLRSLYAAYYALDGIGALVSNSTRDELIEAGRRGVFESFIDAVETGERAIARWARIPSATIEAGIAEVRAGFPIPTSEPISEP
jgi:hypothetical protein